MPPSGDRVNRVLRMGIEDLGYCGIGKRRTMIVLVKVESEPFAYRIEIVESESHCWSLKETSSETGFSVVEFEIDQRLRKKDGA